MAQKLCAVCSVEFSGATNAKYCDACPRPERAAKLTAYKAAKRAAKGIPQIGDEMKCAMCSIIFVKTKKRQKYCDPCAIAAVRLKERRYAASNPEKRSESYRRHDAKRKDNPERIAQKAESVRRNFEIVRNDPQRKLHRRVSQLVYLGLKGKKSGRSWVSILDFTIEELSSHLETLFLPGMGWHNMGAWHVDHIIPRSKFVFHSETDEQFKLCWSINNLQPLWAIDNIKKGNKSPEEYAALLARQAANDNVQEERWSERRD